MKTKILTLGNIYVSEWHIRNWNRISNNLLLIQVLVRWERDKIDGTKNRGPVCIVIIFWVRQEFSFTHGWPFSINFCHPYSLSLLFLCAQSKQYFQICRSQFGHGTFYVLFCGWLNWWNKNLLGWCMLPFFFLFFCGFQIYN